MREFGEFGPGICCFSEQLNDRGYAAVIGVRGCVRAAPTAVPAA